VLLRSNAIFQAVACQLTFDTRNRVVLLTISSEDGRTWINMPESLMANVTGQFIRQRLFGLH